MRRQRVDLAAVVETDDPTRGIDHRRLDRFGAVDPSSRLTPKNSSGRKTRIFSSRAASTASAADCTRPAESPARSRRLSSGETVNPTTLSRNHHACRACTRS